MHREERLSRIFRVTLRRFLNYSRDNTTLMEINITILHQRGVKVKKKKNKNILLDFGTILRKLNETEVFGFPKKCF